MSFRRLLWCLLLALLACDDGGGDGDAQTACITAATDWCTDACVEGLDACEAFSGPSETCNVSFNTCFSACYAESIPGCPT